MTELVLLLTANTPSIVRLRMLLLCFTLAKTLVLGGKQDKGRSRTGSRLVRWRCPESCKSAGREGQEMGGAGGSTRRVTARRESGVAGSGRGVRGGVRACAHCPETKASDPASTPQRRGSGVLTDSLGGRFGSQRLDNAPTPGGNPPAARAREWRHWTTAPSVHGERPVAVPRQH